MVVVVNHLYVGRRSGERQYAEPGRGPRAPARQAHRPQAAQGRYLCLYCTGTDRGDGRERD